PAAARQDRAAYRCPSSYGGRAATKMTCDGAFLVAQWWYLPASHTPEERDAVFPSQVHQRCPWRSQRPGSLVLVRYLTEPRLLCWATALSLGPPHPLQGLRRPQPGRDQTPRRRLASPGPAVGARDSLSQLRTTLQRGHCPPARRPRPHQE